MTKILIVLKGRSNIGKSTTVRLTFDGFIKYCDVKLIEYFKRSKKGKDFRAITELVSPNIRVGFTSAGDTASQINENIKHLEKERCKVIVCASRARGGSNAAIAGLSKRWLIESHEQKKFTNDVDRIRGNNATAAKLIWRIRDVV